MNTLGKLTWACVIMAAVLGRAEILVQSDPLVAGTGGYRVYRIPAFTVASDGSLLVVAEGRPSPSDPGAAGDIHLVWTRSTDGGRTWSPASVLHAAAGFDCSDPRLIVDRQTGAVHLQFVQWPTDRGQAGVPVGLGDDSAVIYYQRSADHGQTWSDPVNLNHQVKDPAWASINTGPGLGIQLQWQEGEPSRNGRLLIPAHHRPPAYRGVAIFSDDGGASWTRGGGSTPGFADESEVVELTSGELLWDGRQQKGSARQRYFSRDSGHTWGGALPGDIPITPVDAGLARYSARRAGDDRDRILFSGPLGSTVGAGNSRDNIGVWTSYDEGRTFINPVQIQSGPAAYSVLAKLPDGSIGLIYEVDHRTIRFVRFDLAELEQARHPATLSQYDGFNNPIAPLRSGVGWSGPWTTDGAAVQAGNLEYDGYVTAGDERHAVLRGATMSRQLGLGELDLGQSQDFYLSLFIKRSSAERTKAGGRGSLDVLLQNSDGETLAAFGVGGDENFFVSELGEAVSSPPGVVKRDAGYLVLVKIAAQDNAAGNADRISLAWFEDPASVPAAAADVRWQIVSAGSENSGESIAQIRIAAGAEAEWLIDGLRIGPTFEAVIVDAASRRSP